MADDKTDLEEIMQSWDTMDIGELGTSLLARKATMDRASAKRARKQEKREMAMGVLMAGQALFAGGANKRIAERRAAGQLDQANSPDQLTDLKITGNVYTILDEMENAWKLQDPTNEGFLNLDGTIGTQFMDLGASGIVESPTWETFVDENPEYKNRLEQAIEPQLLTEMKNLGLSNLTQEETYAGLKDNITTNLIGNFIINRKMFTTEAAKLLDMSPGSDDTKLFKLLGGLSLSRLNQVKIRRMNEDISDFRKGGNLFNRNGYLSALSRIAPGLVDEPENGIFNAVLDYQDTGIDVPLQALSIKNGVSQYFNEERHTPRMRNYLGRAADPKALETREVVSQILKTGLVDMSRSRKIDTGLQRKRWQRSSGLNKLIIGALVPAGVSFKDRNYPVDVGPKDPPILDQPYEKKQRYKRLKGFGKRILGKTGPVITKQAAKLGIKNPYVAGAAGIGAMSAPIFMKSHLKILQDELEKDKNSQQLNKLTLSSTALYLRLKDKTDTQFNKAFFFDPENPDARVITDDDTLMNAAISYTLSKSVKDIRTLVNLSGDKQTGGFFGASKRGGRFFGDVNNFVINTEDVNNMLENKFSVQDGQFIAEAAYRRLKNPLSKADAINKEFKFILQEAQKGKLSEEEADILLERFVFDIDAAAVYNEALDFSTEFSNTDIINQLKDLEASGRTIYDFMEDYSKTDLRKRQYKRFDDFSPE